MRAYFSLSNILYGLLLAGVLSVALIPGGKVWFLQQLMKIGLFQPGVPADGHGDMAPEMQFLTAEGLPVVLSELRGKVVVINFWATWCPPCRAEMPSLDGLYQELKSRPDIVFLMVDADSNVEKAKGFMKEHGYQLPVALMAGEVPDKVYSGTLPTTLVIDKAGRIVFRETGAADYSSRKFRDFVGQLLEAKQ
ncbi:TlpA family protein disulfide reductase [Chitinophaga flava]|uniref:TlpA family protein disulfide reductase n=1 Tax=Chitinophaga flava TaxID=2259036 RepID=A0A365XYM2_9BACT|nr:TlpA disulfide reductase family protein [Chitinophaga flava]RBL91479.1 TlpA family protein disulfide reductase [Chitinophaga flava]